MEEESNLRDMMNRLRYATGKVSAAPKQEVAPRIGERCLLAIQQALCRHPALIDIAKSRDDLKKELMEKIQNSLQIESAPVDEVGRILWWINEASETLEMERLSAVYHDPKQVADEVRQRTLEELGVETLPKFSQCSIGDLSPWNVSMHLVTGPMMTADETRCKRAELQITNATPTMIARLVDINTNVYNTASWVSLLNSLEDYPIKAIRHIWLAASYFFPTCGPVIVAYLRKEISEIGRGRCLWEERDEDDAKEAYKSHCRVLNCFFRHLPLCFSVDLYRLFLDFLETYIRPNDFVMDSVFRVALQRDVGHCPSSTNLWRRFLRWKGDRIYDHHLRREWVRKMYIRMLRTPLCDLQDIKENYDYFVKTEYRGKPPREGRLEERYVRAKMTAIDLSRSMAPLFTGSVAGAPGGGEPLPRSLYLPRPVRLHPNTVDGAVDVSEEAMRRSAIEIWILWTSIIERELNSSAYVGIELFGYERLRFFLTMRASFFPHEAYCWISYVDFCLGQQPLLSEAERKAMARDALEKVTFLLNGNFYIRIAYCDYMLHNLADPECAHRSMKMLLMQQRQIVVDYIKGSSMASLAAVISALERITLISINWMRWGSIGREATNTQFIRLVARFTMHRVDFLSLIMGVVRLASKENSQFTPRCCQQAFNTFCHFWIKLELVRNLAKTEAVMILERWKEHLKMFITSARDKNWSLVDCGLDDCFISSCADVCHSDAAAVPKIFEFLEDIKHSIIDAAAASSTGSFPPLEMEMLVSRTQQLRDNFFVVDANTTSPTNLLRLPEQLVSTRLNGAAVPLQTYDSSLFTTKWIVEDLRDSLTSVTHTEAGTDGSESVAADFRPSVEAMPDDSRWTTKILLDRAVQLHTEKVERTGNRGSTGVDHKWKKVKRLPNRRALVVRNSVLKDLPVGIENFQEGSPNHTAVQHIHKLLADHLPSTYETDPLFANQAIDTEWLLGVLQETPALC
ncbi:hypothetical protein ERJ75_001655800 [Trypanosoma vivax]|uniref:Suppressor of forked domain-containing protein n=1 Tax=Trypanosoma vivax (strain Y486) TaxID=1055687 RepID=G0U9E5_TRYVY|nr:hypothetical protein TRVL_05157 [Trypanosoma vivax]KAH8604903.1 hypothetical protein ERJ75_001655800 [Trypanosoma vivax]CCC54230.1 putative Hypothetical protein [Trypanosoma vivax Y486]